MTVRSQRIIQKEGSPLILTGYAALNRLLGRSVYTSHNQLGGTQIMHHNGVAHLTVADDQVRRRPPEPGSRPRSKTQTRDPDPRAQTREPKPESPD